MFEAVSKVLETGHCSLGTVAITMYGLSLVRKGIVVYMMRKFSKPPSEGCTSA